MELAVLDSSIILTRLIQSTNMPFLFSPRIPRVRSGIKSVLFFSYDDDHKNPLKSTDLPDLLTNKKPYLLLKVEYELFDGSSEYGRLLFVKKMWEKGSHTAVHPPSHTTFCCNKFPNDPTEFQFMKPDTFGAYRDLGVENTFKALEAYGDKFFSKDPVSVPEVHAAVYRRSLSK